MEQLKTSLVGFTALIVLLTAGAAQSLAGSDTVYSDDIVAGQVYGSDIANHAVTGGKILDTTITAADLATNSVTSAKILNGTIVQADLDPNLYNALLGGALPDGSVTTAKLANGAVTNPKLGDNSITTGKIADGAVGTADLASNAVGGTKVADNSLTGADIAESTLVTPRFNASVNCSFAAAETASKACATLTFSLASDAFVDTRELWNDNAGCETTAQWFEGGVALVPRNRLFTAGSHTLTYKISRSPFMEEPCPATTYTGTVHVIVP